MNPSASPRHPLKAIMAIAAMFAAVHGACARADTRAVADVARVDVVDPLPLREACPDLDEAEFADRLASVWEDAAKPSTVAVTFRVRGHHVYDAAPESNSPRTFHAIRRAVHGMRCGGDDDQAHAVSFYVRFVDRDDGSRVASISEAAVDDMPGR
jgi:hypothetical protein